MVGPDQYWFSWQLPGTRLSPTVCGRKAPTVQSEPSCSIWQVHMLTYSHSLKRIHVIRAQCLSKPLGVRPDPRPTLRSPLLWVQGLTTSISTGKILNRLHASPFPSLAWQNRKQGPSVWGRWHLTAHARPCPDPSRPWCLNPKERGNSPHRCPTVVWQQGLGPLWGI